MKKTLLISALLLSSLANAADLEKVSNTTQVTYELKLEKTRNDVAEVVYQYSATTLVGVPTPAANYKTVTYIKECVPNPRTKKIDLTPGTVNAGLNTTVTLTEGKDNGQYNVTLSADYTELLGIKKINDGKCEVDLPDLKVWNFTNSNQINVNEEIVISTFSNNAYNYFSDKEEEITYKVILRVVQEAK
jgi:LysM repeat protein